LKVKIVHSKPEKSSCLNACVLLRRESIVVTPDPSAEFIFAQGRAKGKLGRVC
jgi:hypothetical protein